MSEWRPIEMAPDDGTEVLLFWRDPTGQQYAAIGWYLSQEEVDRIRDVVSIDDGDVGWWTYVNSWSRTQIHPTHWLPLPENRG